MPTRNTAKLTEDRIRKKTLAGNLNASGLRFGIVVSRFNEFITDRLLRSAYDGLLRSGAQEKDIQIVRVPGSFEIPSAARTVAETKKYDAIICIGMPDSRRYRALRRDRQRSHPRHRPVGAGDWSTTRIRRPHLRESRTSYRPRWLENGQQRLRSRAGRDRDGKSEKSYQPPAISRQQNQNQNQGPSRISQKTQIVSLPPPSSVSGCPKRVALKSGAVAPPC